MSTVGWQTYVLRSAHLISVPLSEMKHELYDSELVTVCKKEKRKKEKRFNSDYDHQGSVTH